MSTFFSLFKNLAASHSQEDIKREAEEMKFGSSLSMSVSSDLTSAAAMGASSNNSTSDFNQWLHAMKMVARLPGGMPPEFRRKLWLALADQHLQTKKIDWEKEQIKCLCEQWRDDDEELGIQIVKDLHRTGSSLFSGPAGSLNQAKLKRVLIGYARWNPEVGYCQGFNMLAALILQVMDKNDIESLKVMIFLVEGVLPPGYFCGSLGGLQADMAVFRDLLAGRLPKLAKHLQKLQGTVGEASFEPPLTNVFTMQWFLTLFCTCLPINCVLRVWDLVLIEGSDILLRTALAIWGLLEERILATKTADEFYCNMGTLSGELLNGHLFDSNGLIQKVVELGAVQDLQKMRDKHLNNIPTWKDKRGIRIFFSDEDGDSDDDSKIAVTTAWGIKLGRRGHANVSTNIRPVDKKETVALDISVLKKQYEKLRERQRQAHIILTTNTRPTVNSANANSMPVNQYLMGRSAIVSNKGRRMGPPAGAIPPMRKPISKLSKSSPKQLKKSDSLDYNARKSVPIRKDYDGKEMDGEETKEQNSTLQNSPSLTSSLSSISDISCATSSKSRRKSESSSYSEDSDGNSSTSTSLCDDENFDYSSIEASPLRKFTETKKDKTISTSSQLEECIDTLNKLSTFHLDTDNLETIDELHLSENESCLDTNLDTVAADTVLELDNEKKFLDDYLVLERKTKLISYKDSTQKSLSEEPIPEVDDVDDDDDDDDNGDNVDGGLVEDFLIKDYKQKIEKENEYLQPATTITSTSQLSPIADLSKYISTSTISPLKTPSSFLDYSNLSSKTSNYDEFKTGKSNFDFQVDEDGVTNEYFEHINIPERPSRLDLQEKLSERLDVSLRQKQLSEFDVSNEEESNKTSGRLFWPSQVVDLKIGHLSPQSPIIPSCTDITKIPPEKSPLIHRNSLELKDSNAQRDQDRDRSTSIGDSLPNRTNFLREKSFSLDEPQKCRQEFRPTSCPEVRSDTLACSKKSTDRVLKIIEENSMILHKILKKNTSVIDTDINERALFIFEKDNENEIDITNTYDCPKFEDSEKFEFNSDSKKYSDQEELEEEVEKQEKLEKSDDDGNLEVLTTVSLSNEKEEQYSIYSALEKEFNNDEKKEKSLSLRSIDSILSYSSETKIEDEPLFDRTISTNQLGDENCTKLLPIISEPIFDQSEKTNATILKASPNFSLEEDKSIGHSKAMDDEIIPSKTDSILEKTGGRKVVENYLLECQTDISETLSSIKNTIKSIDSLCQDSDNYKRFKKDSNIESPKFSLEIEKGMKESFIPPSVYIEKTSGDSVDTFGSIDKKSLMYGRHSRDYHRDISPRRRRDDDRDEYESRIRRDLSPNVMSKSDVLPQKSFMDFITLDRSLSNFSCNTKTKIHEEDILSDVPEYKCNPSKHLNLIDYNSEDNLSKTNQTYAAQESWNPLGKKLEIRHTTVTSTFYDRFLLLKKERSSKIDKSPSSPIITKSYLDTLKPPSVERNSKSAENSPSRYKIELSSENGSLNQTLDYLKCDDTNITSTNYYLARSCDNLPAKIDRNSINLISADLQLSKENIQFTEFSSEQIPKISLLD